VGEQLHIDQDIGQPAPGAALAFADGMHVGRGDQPPGDQYLTQLHRITTFQSLQPAVVRRSQMPEFTVSLLSHILPEAKRQAAHLKD